MSPLKPSASRALLLLGALLAAGCISPVVEGERPCPCAEGWLCCEDVQLCVANAARCEQLRPPQGTPKEPKAPSAPLSLTATPGVRTMGLVWFDPLDTGGTALTGFDVQVAPLEEGVLVRLDGRTARVEGLRAGATYRFTVAARNAVGAGPVADTGPVRLPDVPAAPTRLVAERGDRKARVTWEAPFDGGLPVLRYGVTLRPGNVHVEVAAPALSAQVEGLPNGVPVAFTVRAINAVGEGPESDASMSVVPATRPGAPRSVSATPTVRGASVTWTAPVDTGGAPVSGYRVTASPGGASLQVDGATPQATLTGLEDDTAYTFTVVSRNGVGEGPGVTSASVRTPALPAVPRQVQAAPGVRSLTVSWEPPTQDGGRPLTGYTVRVLPANVSLDVGPDARTATLQDIPSTARQVISVAARNAVGEGPTAVADGWMRTLPAPVEVTLVEVPPAQGGCVPVHYTLRQPDGERADVVVEVDPEGDGTFLRARQAGSTVHDGLAAVSTSPEGTSHAFLWNRSPDLWDAAPDARIRVTATVPGTAPSSRPLARPLESTRQRCELELRASPVQWTPPQMSAATPSELTHGDFNRDGKPDVLVSQRGTSAIHLLRGRGNGGFAPAVEVREPLWVDAIASADLDGDGVLDLVTAGSANQATLVRVSLGRGDGTFEAPVITPLLAPRSDFAYLPLLVRDLDGDEQPEVVLAQSGTFFVLRHRWGGYLEVAFQDTLGMHGRLVSGDFDGDGREDVMMAGPSLIAWYGRGFLDFTVEHLLPLGTAVSDAKAADFNGDGHLDLATAVRLQDDSVLQLRLGDGQGRFGAPTELLRHPAPLWDFSPDLAVEDLDRDGARDLACLNTHLNTVSILEGHGDGTFDVRTVPTARSQVRIASADFDGSGLPDLLLASADRNVRVMRDLSQASRAEPGTSPALADFDGDGWNDVVSLTGDSRARVHVTRAGQGLVPREPFAVPPGTWKLMPGRFDADGTMDLLARRRTEGSGQELVLLRGNADGTFSESDRLSLSGIPLDVVTGDVEGDGDLDVVYIMPPEPGTFGTYEVRLLRSHDNGTFAPPVLVAAHTIIPSVTLGDLNRDGRADLTLLRNVSAQAELTFFEGQADGTLVKRLEQSPHLPCTGVSTRVDDLDQDGAVDVVLACWSNEVQGLLPLWGSGGFRFFTQAFHATPTGTPGHAVADLDQDGWKDLVAVTSNMDVVCVLRSKGAPGRDFDAPVCFGTLPTASVPLPLDLDHDGLTELLVSGNETSDITTLLRAR
jgi:hypothetical protein